MLSPALRGYAMGIFPMAETRRHLLGGSQTRGVLPLDGFRMSRSLARRIRQRPRVTLNADFEGVFVARADRSTPDQRRSGPLSGPAGRGARHLEV